MEFAKVAAITFVTVLAADLFDKGSVLVGFLSMRRLPWAVFFGSAAAMVTSCAVWVFAGNLVAPLIRGRYMHWAAGGALVIMGVVVLFLEQSDVLSK